VLKQQRELYFGLIRIHVLVHAAHEPVFGLGMMEELKHHGYRIGRDALSAAAWAGAQWLLKSDQLRKWVGGSGGFIRILARGRSAGEGWEKVDEFYEELHEGRPAGWCGG